jgi:hypothetical protein
LTSEEASFTPLFTPEALLEARLADVLTEELSRNPLRGTDLVEDVASFKPGGLCSEFPLSQAEVPFSVGDHISKLTGGEPSPNPAQGSRPLPHLT